MTLFYRCSSRFCPNYSATIWILWIYYFTRIWGVLSLFQTNDTGFNKVNLLQLRHQAEDLFDHGWNNYLGHAFPLDELRPLSCVGLGPDPDPSNIGINDVLGGYALTLIDSLDMFPLMNRQKEFAYYVQLIEETVSFNVSSTVQVFEVTIRAIGGLLSGHIYASSPRHGHAIEGYNGHLLKLAYDLAKRLLPAFNTPSGIPHPRVNLMHGVVPINGRYITETCSSGAGSLLLEFRLLSELTGDFIFEKVAKRAFMALWQRRSPLGLIGMSIDSQSGEWQSAMTGIGASIDSYYEYAIKFYAVTGDRDLWSIFNTMDTALARYSYDGWLYKSINFYSGSVITGWIDSLSAFYPIINVLSGNISRAVSNHLVYWKLWNTYAGIPERWNFANSRAMKTKKQGLRKNLNTIKKNYSKQKRAKIRSKKKGHLIYLQRALDTLEKSYNSTLAKVEGKLCNYEKNQGFTQIDLEWYPLRPEFIESNYYLYTVTRDPFYLQVGVQVMNDLVSRNKVKCGFAGVQDIRTGQLSDRMESFYLSETVKYLYLLFDFALGEDGENFVIKNKAIWSSDNFVFSTEGHPLWYDDLTIKSGHIQNFLTSPEKHQFNIFMDALSLGLSETDLTSDTQVREYFKRNDSMKEKKESQLSLQIPKNGFFDGVIGAVYRLFLSKNGDLKNEDSSVYDKEMFAANRLIDSITDSRIIVDEPVCEAWKPLQEENTKLSLFSTIGSWDKFHTLDSIYEFRSPDYLSQQRSLSLINNNSQDMFNRVYIDPNGQCVVPDYSVDTDILLGAVNLSIGTPFGYPPAKVEFRDENYSTNNEGKNYYHKQLWMDNLFGAELKLGKYPKSSNDLSGDEGSFYYRVLVINGVNISREGQVLVGRIDVNSDDNFIGISDANELLIQKTRVVNIIQIR